MPFVAFVQPNLQFQDLTRSTVHQDVVKKRFIYRTKNINKKRNKVIYILSLGWQQNKKLSLITSNIRAGLLKYSIV
jgi:hypothetical protein